MEAVLKPLQHGLYSTGDYGEPDELRIFIGKL
jgi:hypothetical protein